MPVLKPHNSICPRPHIPPAPAIDDDSTAPPPPPIAAGTTWPLFLVFWGSKVGVARLAFCL